MKRPAEAELAILNVLWDRGPSSVRDVHEALAASRETGYTTTLKLMQIMTGKRLVARDDAARAHVYVALCSRADIQRDLLADLMQRAFAGSASALVLQALSIQSTSKEELIAIRELIDRAAKQRRRDG